MSDPSDENVYKLIKRNQTPYKNSSDTCVRFRGEKEYEPPDQAKNLTVHFADEASPKEKENYGKHFHQMNKLQHSCIEYMCMNSTVGIETLQYRK